MSTTSGSSPEGGVCVHAYVCVSECCVCMKMVRPREDDMKTNTLTSHKQHDCLQQIVHLCSLLFNYHLYIYNTRSELASLAHSF